MTSKDLAKQVDQFLESSSTEAEAASQIHKAFIDFQGQTAEGDSDDEADEDAWAVKVKRMKWKSSSGKEYSIAHGARIMNPTETWDFAKGKQFTYIMPKSLRGTVNAVLYAEQEGKTIRALGSRHSYGNIVQTDHIYVDMSMAHPYQPKKGSYKPKRHNKKVRELDMSPLERLSVDKKDYFNVPGGMKIHMLNRILWSDKKRDDNYFGKRRLWNMGAGDVQAFAGAFSTGTHGSGGKYSAYHDYIRSIVIVGSEGKVYRVEPETGITDPAKHQLYYEDNPSEVPVVLKQDDDLFYSALVNMGCFGIIFSCIIEVAPATLLREDSDFVKGGWKDVEDKIPELAETKVFSDNPDEEKFFMITINPYALDEDTNPNASSSIVLKTAVNTNQTGVKFRARRRKFWPGYFKRFNVVAGVLRQMLNNHKRPIAPLLETALESLHDDVDGKSGGYTDLSYRVLNAGTGKIQSIGTGIEFAFPAEKVKDVVNKIRAIVKRLNKKDWPYRLNAPVSLRFVKAGNAYLAPNYHTKGNQKEKVWVYIELLRVNAIDEDEDRREREIFQEMQKLMRFEGGRPHWGLNFNYEFSYDHLKELYPKFEEWVKTFHFFNPNGTFDNDFTRQVKLRENAPADLEEELVS